MHWSLSWKKTLLCLGLLFLGVWGVTACSVHHTWLPWGWYPAPGHLKRGRFSKLIKTQIWPSSSEINQRTLSLLPTLEGGNSDICASWTAWAVLLVRFLEKGKYWKLSHKFSWRSWHFVSKQNVTNWIHPSNILKSLCYPASCELPFPLVSTHPSLKAQQTQAQLH